ncbi:hypothetical protein [Streptomyces sp. Y1]|uniref:Uncharacterized protein n=1 Tax=Streptomyces sp. Y1 TaxID=3238634 RepID=A0AB39TJ31_9ACTN
MAIVPPDWEISTPWAPRIPAEVAEVADNLVTLTVDGNLRLRRLHQIEPWTGEAKAYFPECGELVQDRRANRIGVLMDVVGGRLYLRPPNGGVEWVADLRHVVPVGAA